MIWVSIIGTVFFAIWIGLALFYCFFPHLAWRIQYKWRAVEQPPKSYFVIQRIVGGIFAVFGIGLLVFINTR